MISIGFDEAFLLCRGVLKMNQFKALDPRWYWFKLSDGVVALTPSQDGQSIWLHMAAGCGNKWMRELRREAKEFGAKTIAFHCEKGSRVESIVRYYRGTIEPSDLVYDNWAQAVLCTLPIDSERTSHGNPE